MPTGICGKVLWVDLSKETFEEEELPEKIYRQYLGGYGLATKLIYERMPPKTDALGADSIFGFFAGLLTGTVAPFSGRYMVAGKSPLTGTWGDANSGGTFGPEIKKCGYDAILFKGIASSPKYVALIDGNKEILDASDIWGLDIIEAELKLKEKHGNFIKTAGIGQAGENLSLISGIANDRGRIAARSGIGAVMGSKKLKILVLKGKEKLSMVNREIFMENVKWYNSKNKAKKPGFMVNMILKTIPKLSKTMRRFKIGMDTSPGNLIKHIYHKFGTTVSNTLSAEIGDSPVKNWGGVGQYDYPPKKSMDISALAIGKYVQKPYGCITCPIQCGAILKVPELNIEQTHRPEYETCCAFGTNLLNHDLLSIFELNELCNRATIDTISAGATVAFAIECFENGILTLEDTDGLELTWGNSKAIVELTKKMINREGIGDILADGCKKAAEKIGKGSEKYAIHSLGQEIAMHNPRMFKSLAYTYTFDPTPGRHTAASVDFLDLGPVEKFVPGFSLPKGWKKNVKKKMKGQMMTSCLQQTVNSLGLCMFSTLFGAYPLYELIESLTGWEMNVDEFLQIGWRIQTLRQAFSLREGIDIASNELPGRVTGHPPDEIGPMKGVTVEYKDFAEGVCKELGWNPENGVPLEETLKKLDIDFIIKDFY